MALPNMVPDPVPTGPHFPGFCVCCRGGGPFIDTGTDWADVHIYLCRSCSRDVAKGWGYVKGPRAEALDEASDRLVAAESERDEAQDAARKMAEALTAERAKTTALKRDNDELRDKSHQTLFRVEQAGTTLNEILVAANGN